VAWEDLNLDGDYDSTGNVMPAEPFGQGGIVNFAAGPLSECSVATGSGALAVTKTEKTADRYEANGCSLFYDSNDIFTVDGAAASLQDFEDALSIGDVVTSTYDPDTADQSNFAVVDGTAALTVTDPTAPTTVDAASYAIKGTADPGATIRIRQDVNNNGVQDPGDNIVATGTADADGVWTVNTPLAQGVANDFLASQLPAFTGATEVGTWDVARITEGASAGATITASGLVEGGTGSVVDPFDTIVIVFSEGIAGVSSGDTVTVSDGPDTGTITNGTNATFTVGTTVVPNDTLTIALTAVIPGNAIGSPTTITAVGGFTDDDGEAINVAGSGAARTFAH
jgi:hypothetical protein